MEHHCEHYMVSNPETSDLKVTITQNVCSSSTLGGTGDSNTKDGESGYGWRRRIELRRNLKVKRNNNDEKAKSFRSVHSHLKKWKKGPLGQACVNLNRQLKRKWADLLESI